MTLSPEIKAAIDALYQGTPLGEVTSRLEQINRRAVVESYRNGMASRECARKHGLTFGQVCAIVKQDAPDILRPCGPAGWTKTLARRKTA